MKEFQIYRIISDNEKDREREIAVLTTCVFGGQTVQCSVNRHIHPQNGQWIGRHPDFYDGVDAKNTRAEDVVAHLESRLEFLIAELEQLDEVLDKWSDSKKFKEMTSKTVDQCVEAGLNPESVDKLLNRIRPLVIQKLKADLLTTKDKAIVVGIDLEYAKRHLAEVQEKFPRLVAYV